MAEKKPVDQAAVSRALQSSTFEALALQHRQLSDLMDSMGEDKDVLSAALQVHLRERDKKSIPVPGDDPVTVTLVAGRKSPDRVDPKLLLAAGVSVEIIAQATITGGVGEPYVTVTRPRGKGQTGAGQGNEEGAGQ